MEALFLKILNMSLTGAVVILAVLLVSRLTTGYLFGAAESAQGVFLRPLGGGVVPAAVPVYH